MNKALLCLLAAALPLLSQAVRVDPTPVMKTAGNVGPGAYPQLLAVPGPQVSVCAAPANGVPCTNHAITYSDATATTACPSNAQITIAASNTCVAFGDRQGNFGFWILPGSYSYTVTFAGQNFGPYPFTAQVSSTGPVDVPTNILTFGCIGNQIHNDQPCFVSAFAANVPLIVPPGNYLIDLSAFSDTWYISNWSKSITFSAGAKWVVVPPANHAISSMIVFNVWSNAVVNGLHIGLQTPQTSACTIGPSYCSNMLAVINSGTSTGGIGPTFNSLQIDNALATALITSNNYNATFNDTSIGPSAGTIFNGNENLRLNGFSCPTTVWDDCLNITSQSAAIPGTVGAFLTNLYSFDAWGSGLRIGTAEVTVDGFEIIAAQNDAITIQNNTIYSQTDPPARIVIANGTVRSVRNTGHATSPGAAHACVELDTNVVGNNVGNITIDNVHCISPDGEGVTTYTAGNLSNGNLIVSNMQVQNAGNAVDPAAEGSCFHILGMASFNAANNTCDGAKGYGYYIDGIALGAATITGGKIKNANTLQGAGHAISLLNLTSHAVTGVDIIDNRNPAASWIVSAANTVRSGIFSAINFEITNQGTAHHPAIDTDSANDIFANISPPLVLANTGSTHIPGNGTILACFDCDTPASQGATCTSSGDKLGAQMIVARGVRKCY